MTPAHTSHSSINSYLRCGKAFELESLKNYPSMPAWWLIGGSAVHKVTEDWDNGHVLYGELESAAQKALAAEMEKALVREPQMELWLAGGWGKTQQRFDHWNEKVVRYAYQWADLDWGAGYDHSWVELNVSTTLPSGAIKGFVDRVTVDHERGLIEISDLKSGSTRPDSDQQLGIYSVLTREWLANELGRVLRNYDILATNYMFKDNEFYPVDVSNWTLETVDKMAQEWYDGVKSAVFLPNRGSLCARCSVSAACYLQSGDTATTRAYDSLNPNYGRE